MARCPVLHWQQQSYHVLQPTWNAVQWRCMLLFLWHASIKPQALNIEVKKVNNRLKQTVWLWTYSETRLRSPFAKPLITAGTGRWSLWSLLWWWSPAFPVPGPAQLPGGATYRLFQWPLEWRCELRIVGCICGGKAGCSSCFHGCVANVGVGMRVRDCDVPCQRLSLSTMAALWLLLIMIMIIIVMIMMTMMMMMMIIIIIIIITHWCRCLLCALIDWVVRTTTCEYRECWHASVCLALTISSCRYWNSSSMRSSSKRRWKGVATAVSGSGRGRCRATRATTSLPTPDSWSIGWTRQLRTVRDRSRGISKEIVGSAWGNWKRGTGKRGTGGRKSDTGKRGTKNAGLENARMSTMVGGVAQWLGRRSLTGGYSLIYTCSSLDLVCAFICIN